MLVTNAANPPEIARIQPGIDLAPPLSIGMSMTIRTFAYAVAVAGTAHLLEPALSSAQQDPATATAPKIIEVTARKFEFEPALIEVVEGERVRLLVRSADGVHGFEIK